MISKFKKKTRKSRKHRLRMRRRGSYNVIAILAICPIMVRKHRFVHIVILYIKQRHNLFRIFFGVSVRPWRGNTDISVFIFFISSISDIGTIFSGYLHTMTHCSSLRYVIFYDLMAIFAIYKKKIKNQ